MIRVSLAAAALAVVLVGCAAPPTPVATTPPPAAAPAPVVEPRPLAIAVPSIDTASTLIPTGLLPDGAPEVPPLDRPEQASWYCPTSDPGQRSCDWPMPGQRGPAVILGHIDGYGQPGIFKQLGQVQPGTEIVVDRAGAEPARFEVVRVETVPKAVLDDPATGELERIYADTPGPELRLVSCGGDFDGEHYRDQVVVYARAA